MKKRIKGSKRAASRNQVSYGLLDRIADFLICSRCFRNNRVQPIRRPLSQRHQPVALCRKCSAELNHEHEADLVMLARTDFRIGY
jgi:superfamily II helicase